MKKTAIILFADLPGFEAKKKSLSNFSSQKATEKLSQTLTQHFYNLAKQSAAETFLIDTYHQKGKSFGERITNAFIDVYAKGYENVICIGNDCLDLSLELLQKSIVQVENNNVVLGPTFDGGAYLIGIPIANFDLIKFQNINWQNTTTFKNLQDLFYPDYVKLEVLVDVDYQHDFSFTKKDNPLLKVLLTVIKSFINSSNFSRKPLKAAFFHIDSAFLKGPPLFSI
ncbi:TIGR04282 family arsenosugar biosynthesis glycosyltransferase [Pedobacter alpinus]|uniref:DUF2064 domain-containing protein n=1 Tax=Pedobacter alpinus TaxID=1590643 RepID=A0ABW5TWK1_9SPHI